MATTDRITSRSFVWRFKIFEKDTCTSEVLQKEDSTQKQPNTQKVIVWRMMKCNYVYMVLILILSFYASFTSSTSTPINISLGFVTPLHRSYGPLSGLGNELVSAFKLAVDAVNKDAKDVWIRSDFLDDIKDEGNNPDEACKEAARYFNNDDKYVGIIGAYSSRCSQLMQEELSTLNSLLPQVSYRSPSITFLNKDVYPNFFRTTSNNKKQAQVIVDVIKHFRWSQASVIHTSDMLYGKELSDEIVSLAPRSGVTIKERVSFSSKDSLLKIDQILQTIRTSGSRINILVAQGNDVFRLIKQIKNKKMYGEGWVWLCTDGAAGLYMGSDKVVNSTASGFVAVGPEMFKGKLFLRLLVSWFAGGEEDYPGKIWRSDLEPAVSPYVGQVFRAVSAYHNLLTQLVRSGNLTARSTGSEIRSMLAKRFKSLNDSLTGVSSVLGPRLYFDRETDDRPKFTILNCVKGEFKDVGTWNGISNPRLNLPAETIIWPGGSLQTPTDKGRPGKALFRIGFVSPTNIALGSLARYGRELVSAFRVAIDIINNDPNYKVELDGIIQDEGIDGDSSCQKVAEELSQLNPIAVVGAYRSKCSMKLHNVLGTASKKIPIVSYASTSNLLSNKTKYPYFFRVVPSNKHESQIFRDIVRKYGFTEVSILYSDEVASMEIAKDFEKLMQKDTVSVTISKKFPQNSHANSLRSYVEDIRQSGSQVILVSAQQNDAHVILQLVKELEMAGKGWIWLGSDGASTSYYHKNSDVAKALDGMLGVNPKHGDGGLYLKLLSAWMQKDKFRYPGIVHSSPGESSLPFTAQVFDAVNGIAMALSDLVSRSIISHRTNALTVRNVLYEKLKTYNSPDNGYLSATGLSAKMYFDRHQNGPLDYSIVNLVKTKWNRIGTYSKNRELRFSTDPLFPGGTIIPYLGAGKRRYEVAAFVPKNKRYKAFSELSVVWESALKAAVGWVNQNDSLTVGFDLTIYDSGVPLSNCSTLEKLLPSNVDIIIGPARSECMQIFYEHVHLRGVPVLTYASTSSVLSKKTQYPNLFRLSPSDSYQAEALTDLIEKYLWEKVGIIAAEGIYGKELSAEVENSLKSKSIRITRTEVFKEGTSRLKDHMNALKLAGSGVNLVIANPNDAIKLYQQAFELGMVGKGWTWIGSDGAISSTFKTKQNLRGAMQGMVGFRPKLGKGKTFDDIFNTWKDAKTESYDQVPYVAQVIDSILLPSIALHKLHREKKVTPRISKRDVRRYLINELKTMQSIENSFESATGKKLFFDSHQDVVPAYDLVNLNGEQWVTVGSYEKGQLHITSNIVWPGGTVTIPPSKQPDPDNESTVEESGGTSHGLIVLAVVFSIFGLLVIVFMIYIVRRVRYRHLYMQSDLNQGGVFSVLYGHTVNRPGINLLQSTPNGHMKSDMRGDLSDPMIPRHV